MTAGMEVLHCLLGSSNDGLTVRVLQSGLIYLLGGRSQNGTASPVISASQIGMIPGIRDRMKSNPLFRPGFESCWSRPVQGEFRVPLISHRAPIDELGLPITGAQRDIWIPFHDRRFT
jgi:hypothetical protein